jgi:hypothetical protein
MAIHRSGTHFSPGKHSCALRSDYSACGVAVSECAEDDEGHFWVSNGEYSSMVAFCPVCGVKASTPPTDTPRNDKWLDD